MPTKIVFEYPSDSLVAENNQKGGHRVYSGWNSDEHILRIRHVSAPGSSRFVDTTARLPWRTTHHYKIIE